MDATSLAVGLENGSIELWERVGKVTTVLFYIYVSVTHVLKVNRDVRYVTFTYTLMSRINVVVRLLIFGSFSHQYAPYSGHYDY